MNKTRQSINILTFSLLFMMSIIVVPHVRAEEITISGNGANSVNEAVTSSSHNATVIQSSNATINNSITTTTTTGNNEASNNTGGDTIIVTGNATDVTTVTNSVNQSVINQNCCTSNQTGSVNISGNGAESHNSATNTSDNNATIKQSNNANIATTIYKNISTGNNKANNNTGGDVVIKTGNIKSSTKVTNALLNLSYISVPQNNKKALKLKVFGNGYGTYNNADLSENDKTAITVLNAAAIINDLKEKYITGNNKANYNLGDVLVSSGDIENNVAINNQVNVSIAKIACDCDKEKEEEKKPAPVGGNVPPPTATTTISNTGPSVSGVPTVSSGPNLPITGGNWLVLALFGNIMMLLLGGYLRLRSGRSPGYEFAL